MMFIYDVHLKHVLVPIEFSDGWLRYVYLDYDLRAVARSHGHARALARRFMDCHQGIRIDFTQSCSVRKIGLAWNGARPDCDWPIAFEHRCMTADEVAA